MSRPVAEADPADRPVAVAAGAQAPGGDPGGARGVAPWVVGAVLVALVAGITAVAVWGSRTDGARVTVRVPEGTAAAVARGEDPGLVDEVLWLRVGDRITLVNDDSVLHRLGPLAAGPGERARMSFDDQARIDGATTLRPTGTVTIVVRPRNAPDPTVPATGRR